MEGISNAFEVALSLTQKISDREVEEKILKDLPGEWRERLGKQCARKAHGKHWVKVLKPCPLSRERLEQALTLAHRGRTPHLEDRTGEYIMECQTEEAQEKILELDGWEIPGAGRLEVKWAARKPTWSEMFKLLEAELRVEADIAPLRKTKGVNAVTETAPTPKLSPREKSQPTKGKGKGKARAWSPAKGRGKAEAPAQKSPQGGAADKGSTPSRRSMCYPCDREGRPALHDYWECPHWKADREERVKQWAEQKGKAPMPKREAAAKPAAPSSLKKYESQGLRGASPGNDSLHEAPEVGFRARVVREAYCEVRVR